jgi:hypothetical protein
MMTVLGQITKEIRDQIEREIMYLTSGVPEDYAHYRETVGKIVALRAIEDFVVDTNKKIDSY